MRDLTLPPIADQAGENATATVPLAFAPVTGSNVRVTIVDVREAITFNYYAQTVEPPARRDRRAGNPGSARTGARGRARGRVPRRPLRIDDVPVPVRVTGTTAAAVARQPLSIESVRPHRRLRNAADRARGR